MATPLHPAVLDMVRHQHAFLCDSFSVLAAEALREPGGRRLSERAWNRAVDLARIGRPVYGTIKDSSRVLDSNVRGGGYIHLVGQCRRPPTHVASRLLLEYDGDDEDEVTDAEMFLETRASTLVRNTLLDYHALHAHADDGVAIGAYCGGEIQPVIAGIDAYLNVVLKERGGRLYGLRVTVFSTASDNSSVMRWLDAWRERWQQDDQSSSKQHYGVCRISLSYRVVSSDADHEQLSRLLRDTGLDVMFFTDMVESGGSRFEEVNLGEIPDDGYRRFPVLEMACCAVTSGGRALQRERVLSHRRFTLAALHAEVMARISNASANREARHVVMSQSDFGPWERVVDAAHEGSAWVVCIDPTVDDQLLRHESAGAPRKREIIGFGTGVGAHGESNYTVSTEQYSLADVKKRIAAVVASLLGPLHASVSERIAGQLVSEAAGLAGLSVVKATGPSEYVRDYIAYATLRMLLKRDAEAFCDEIVSLDAFSHWFDDAPSGMRPDLLRLRAHIVDGQIEVEAQIIECKLAQWSEDHLAKAHEQVVAGLTRLIDCFRPRPVDTPMGIYDRPDQRYWWMQLHRLLASRGSTTKPRYRDTLAALERLAEGYYSISWQGAVVAFWTDVDRDTLQREAEWALSMEGETLRIPAITSGGGLIRRACLEHVTADLFAGVPALRKSARLGTRRATSEASEDGNGRDALALPEEDGRGASDAAMPTPRVEEGPAPMGRSEHYSVAKATPRGEPRVEPVVSVTHVREAQVRADGVVERVLLGQTIPGDRDVFWEFGHPELPNRHILVFGASGTGKTYTIQALLCELGRAGHNTLIVDYTEGFTTGHLEDVVREKLAPRQHIVRTTPLPINPFRQQYDLIDDQRIEEMPSNTAQRVAGVFSEVYALGDIQKSVLYSAIRDGIAEDGTLFELEGLLDRLENARSAGGPTATSAASVISKIQPFVDMRPFGQEDPQSWESLYGDQKSRCHIIQLAGFSRDVSRLITEFSLIDLYRYYRATGSKDRPRSIVLDEIQNLDHKLQSPLGQLLTEGRKFGISLILATQTLSSLDSDARDRLFQASHKLFFKPADTELPSFSKILENATEVRASEWVKRLSSLSRGECYSLGPIRNEVNGALEMKRCAKIRVTALDRRF